MADPASEAGRGALKLDFDRSLVLQFRGSAITSDAGLLPYRELDDALSLTDTGADMLSDTRTGRNGRHRLAGLLRRSVFGRLAGYEDVNDAHRLCRDPAHRWVVGDRAITGCAASASQKPAQHGGAMDQRGQGRDQMDAAVMPFLRGQCRPPSASCACLQLGNFMRTLAMPKAAEPWSLTSLRDKLIKIGAKVVSHGRYVTFQMAEVAVSRQMFADILSLSLIA